MCAPASVLGAGMEGGLFLPPLPFYWVINRGLDCRCAPHPLSCLPRLPPLSPAAARRNSMPIRFGALRLADQSRAAALEQVEWGSRLCSPGSGHPPCVPRKRRGQAGQAAPSLRGAQRPAWDGAASARTEQPAGHRAALAREVGDGFLEGEALRRGLERFRKQMWSKQRNPGQNSMQRDRLGQRPGRQEAAVVRRRRDLFWLDCCATIRARGAAEGPREGRDRISVGLLMMSSACWQPCCFLLWEMGELIADNLHKRFVRW